MESSTDIEVSGELFAPVSKDIELCYQTFGDPADEALLLVMGLAGPMTWWHEDFCTMLAEAGFFVVRFDNRDTGRSSRGHGRVTKAQLAAAFLGRRVHAPYTIDDLAEDAVGLLDHLAVDRVHVVGVSMGGMIAQSMALAHPHRVRSLTSIMSTTGARTVGWQDPRLLPRMLARRQTERAAYIDTSVTFWNYIGSPGYPQPEDEVRLKAGDTWDRGISASGVLRQMLAITTQRNRTAALADLPMPVLVVHGLADKMVHVSGGRATSLAMPGSELVLIDGMGHDMPRELWPTYVEAIRRVADRSHEEPQRPS